MYKKSFIMLLSIVILIFAASCRGTRTVKVVVANQGIWYVELHEDDGVMTRTGYFTETFDLGDKQSNIIVDAFRITVNAYALKALTVSIIEQYDNGFLYTASSQTKATITNTYVDGPYCNVAPTTDAESKVYQNSNVLAVATVTYDFGPK